MQKKSVVVAAIGHGNYQWLAILHKPNMSDEILVDY
jgi:hypothetical protein